MFEKELRKAVEDTQEFIRNNMIDNKTGKPKKWFININHKERFIRIHPTSGKIDLQQEISKRFYDHYKTELRDLRSGKTFWFGLFDNVEEAFGFSLFIAKSFRSLYNKELRIEVCKDDMILVPIDPFQDR